MRLARAAKHRVSLAVTDDGPGIPPQILPRIFEPFYTTKAAQEGTGLGLAITRAIVRDHGGEIAAESGPEGGATFTITLPAGTVGAEKSPTAVLPARPPERLRGRKVLVVDDEPTVTSLIQVALEREGIEVVAFTDSRQAIERALREPFDLILCDIRMPGLDAPAFYRALCRQRPAMIRRLLLSTGDTLASQTRSFLEQTQLPVLTKPFQVEELRAAVGRAIAEADQQENAGDK